MTHVVSKIPIVSNVVNAIGGAVKGLIGTPPTPAAPASVGGVQALPGTPAADTLADPTAPSTSTTPAAPALGDAATQGAGNGVAAASASAIGRAATILSDQSDSDVTDGDPNLIKKKSLLGD